MRNINRASALPAYPLAFADYPFEAARKTTQPVLVIHGENDNPCPITKAKALFDRIPSPEKEWYAAKGADHDHVMQYGDIANIQRRIIQFLMKHLPPRAAGASP